MFLFKNKNFKNDNQVSMITLANISLHFKANIKCHYCQQADFLKEVIDSLQDGLLIISETGELIYANASAHHIFNQLSQDNYHQHKLPEAIWQICELLVVSHKLFPDKLLILSDEISLDRLKLFRVRVKLLNLEKFKHYCFLVTIENRYESMRNLVNAEVTQYNLTQREADIWSLYRASYSYKEIADHFYISINTVKKHMKNIHAKRQMFLESQFPTSRV
ncbi:LuxR C-terminal-related transcriptional regulator [Fischerella sp. NIES-3754]|uniref:LuxR C-terminal-related transcriptional regulator n=1 Tax=Fischerella sp. NIES-3754 TaxID=1752063 RepID=UPI001E2EC7E0|nr:LuxR C-terminal-related transcriptional regulator [Fischerella sp. NIES-3754]